MNSMLADFLKGHKERYFMPLRFMDGIVEENLAHLCIIDFILFSLGFFNIIIALSIHKGNLAEHSFHFFYYSLPTVISLACGIWATLMRTVFKNFSYKAKNLPFYTTVFGLLFSFMFNFWPDGSVLSSFNGFVLIACLEVIQVIFFNIYTNIFDLLNFPFFILIYFLEVDEIGRVSALNFFIFFFILHFMSYYKWQFTRKHLLQNEEVKNINYSLKHEIELAANIQQNFLNYSVPDVEGWNISYYTHAMAGVTGDMFDFYTTSKRLDGFGIFDVSGHGISSGLITMLVKNIIRSEFYNNSNESLEKTMYKINESVIKQKGAIENYLTGILAKVNKRTLDFIIAGHPHPIVYSSKDDSIDYYIETQTDGFGVIGLADFPVNFNTETVEFSKGDEMILYSDGILDAVNQSGEEYGKARFLKAAKNYITLKPKEQVNFIIDEIRAFCGGDHPDPKDDITLIVIKKL